jgi:hypothetical protein
MGKEVEKKQERALNRSKRESDAPEAKNIVPCADNE